MECTDCVKTFIWLKFVEKLAGQTVCQPGVVQPSYFKFLLKQIPHEESMNSVSLNNSTET